jgi:uncharacterized protein YodC (DUF2158 family)
MAQSQLHCSCPGALSTARIHKYGPRMIMSSLSGDCSSSSISYSMITCHFLQRAAPSSCGTQPMSLRQSCNYATSAAPTRGKPLGCNPSSLRQMRRKPKLSVQRAADDEKYVPVFSLCPYLDRTRTESCRLSSRCCQ